MADDEKLLTSYEAAAQLELNRSTLQRMVKDGKIAVARRGPRGMLMFSPEEVERVRAKRERDQEAPAVQKQRPTRARAVEMAEEALANQLLDQFGSGVFDRRYEPVVRWSVDETSKGAPGTPVLFLSDIHYGERVDPEQVLQSNEFSRETCKRRVQKVFEMAVTLLKTHLARPEYPGIVLLLGGDMINGALHEDSAFSDEVPPLLQAMEIADLVADGVAFLTQEFPRVEIRGVPGNHGRLTRRSWAKFYAATNLDWLSYKLLERSVSSLENVECHFPPVRDMNFTVAGRRYRMTHGDQFRGGDGIIGPLGPVTRGDVRKRHAAALMPEGLGVTYDTLLVGHFHQLMMLPRLIMNGSVKGFDEFALSINVPFEPPQQALWTVHPKHGHTWYLPVLCD